MKRTVLTKPVSQEPSHTKNDNRLASMPDEAANAFKEYVKFFTSSPTEVRITSFSVLSLTTASSTRVDRIWGTQHGFEISEIFSPSN